MLVRGSLRPLASTGRFGASRAVLQAQQPLQLLQQSQQQWAARRSYHWDNSQKAKHYRRHANAIPKPLRNLSLNEADKEFSKLPPKERPAAMIQRLRAFAEGDDAGEELDVEELEANEKLVLKDVNWSRYQRALQIADANLFANQYTYEENTLPPHQWSLGQDEGIRAERLNRETELEQIKFLAQMRHFLIIDRRRHVTISASGRVESFSAMVVAGNGRGAFGFAHCRGVNADEAETKCLLSLHKNMIYVPLFENRTLFYNVVGKHRKTQIKMKVARREHAYKACPMVYYMARCVGFQDLTTKVIGSRNKYQVVKAFMNALRNHTSDRDAAIRMGKNYYKMFDPATYKPQMPTGQEMAQQQIQVMKHLREVRKEWKAKMGRRKLAATTADHYEWVLDGHPDEKFRTMRPSDWIMPRAPCFVPVPTAEGSLHGRAGHARSDPDF